MNKELIDRVWSVLPNEFKEEVKKKYIAYTGSIYENFYIKTFGFHNLTSDAEGEEMLTVPKKRVMEIYNHCNGGTAQAIKNIFGKLIYDMNNDGIITPLDKFKGLPHLNEKQEVITDYEGYAPTLYPYEDKWFVSWVSSEGDSILDFQAESPEKAIESAYNHLFGSKCLPDGNEDNFATKEPKPAEPKFKVGDYAMMNGRKVEIIGYSDRFPQEYRVHVQTENYQTNVKESDLEPYTEPKYHRGEKVRYNGYVYEVEGLVGKNRYALKGLNFDLDEDMIEPCTELEKQSRNLSQEAANCDKQFDNTLKDSFSKERRLNIAAMAMQGLLARIDDTPQVIAETAFRYADALIKEAEKGGDE